MSDNLNPEEQTEIDDAVLFLNSLQNRNSVLLAEARPLTRKQQAIYKTKPWEISGIVRSLPYKSLVDSYKELYFEQHPEERPTK